MQKVGELKRKRKRALQRQRIYDACKWARAGEADVWTTLPSFPGLPDRSLLRIKLSPVDPASLELCEYAYELGFGAVFMVHGAPVFVELCGKDGVVYGPTGDMGMRCFLDKALAIVQDRRDVHPIPTRGNP